MTDKNYYEVLGVANDADARTIKRAFLKKARKLHPDVNKEPGAEEAFKEVNEAYSVLSDEHRRANYDRYGDPNGPGGIGGEYVDMSDIFGGAGFGFSDIFESFFGGGQGQATQRTRGRDMGASLHITLAEAAEGTERTIAYDRLAPCDDCGGSGIAEGGSEHNCERCHGTGRVVEVQRTIFGQMQTQGVCPVCGGNGKIIDDPCDTCGGQGRVPTHESVKVTIPAGVHGGQTIVIKSMGEAGIRGDLSGDLVVRIDVEPSEIFERQGDDLFCHVEVGAFGAILGTTVEIDGILKNERITIEIPMGTQYGDQVRIEGAGMPRQGSSARGSLIALIHVTTPTDLSEKQLKSLRKLLGKDAVAAHPKHLREDS